MTTQTKTNVPYVCSGGESVLTCSIISFAQHEVVKPPKMLQDG
jgi:hypothetical protein